MTEKELIQYLLDMKGQEARLQEQKEKLHSKIESLEEAIQRNSFGSRDDDAGMVSSGSFDKNKLHRILMRAYRDIDNELDAVAEELIMIGEQEEKIKRMLHCINLLPISQAEAIEALYINGMSWQEYAKATCQSKATIGRIRKAAIKHLLKMYEDRKHGGGVEA